MPASHNAVMNNSKCANKPVAGLYDTEQWWCMAFKVLWRLPCMSIAEALCSPNDRVLLNDILFTIDQTCINGSCAVAQCFCWPYQKPKT